MTQLSAEGEGLWSKELTVSAPAVTALHTTSHMYTSEGSEEWGLSMLRTSRRMPKHTSSVMSVANLWKMRMRTLCAS